MKSILRVPDEVKLLEPKQVLTLSPSDKQRYYDRVIMDLLRANSEGVTVGEIEEVTKFMARTIRPHLKALVARGEAICITRGKWTVYQANGEILDKPVAIQSVARLGTVYVVNRIKDNGGTLSYYIQEKELDAYRVLTVKGGITISANDIKHFLTEINTIAMRDARGKTE
jgi:hypothetical protein